MLVVNDDNNTALNLLNWEPSNDDINTALNLLNWQHAKKGRIGVIIIYVPLNRQLCSKRYNHVLPNCAE